MKHSLLFGLLCSPVGIGFGIILRINDWGSEELTTGYGLGFISSAGIAAFLAPCFIWYIMIERRERISVSRGITVGALGAALAHFVCWYLFILRDRKSTRLNSSHALISYAVFCLKKKKNNIT